MLLAVGLLVMLTGLLTYHSGWLLVPVAVLASATGAYGLHRIAAESDPDDRSRIAGQVLWSGLVGRAATGWLFGCLLITAAPALPPWQTAVLMMVGVALFGAGCLQIIAARPGR